MRRAIALLLVLTLLSGAGLACAHRAVDGTREAVEMRETALYGDRAAAEGMRLRVPVYSGGYLFWDTVLETGADGGARTAFRFSAQRENIRDSAGRDGNGLYADLMMNMGVGGNFGTEFDFENEYYGGYEDYFYVVYGELLRDVASRAPAAQEYTERVELSDWIDFVPIRFDLDLPGYIYEYDGGGTYIEANRGSTGALGQALAERFRIPLTESLPVDVSISKNPEGEIVEWHMDGVVDYGLEEIDGEVYEVGRSVWDGFNISTWSVVTENACWFIFDQWQPDRELGRIDFSALPGGRGIYRLPFEYEGEDSQVTKVYLNDIEAMPLLEENERVELLDSDGERLLLFTSDSTSLYLTQFALNEPEKAVKTKLLELEKLPEEYNRDDGIDRVALGQGLYCVWTIAGRLLLLEAEDGGGYEMRLNVRAYPEEVEAGPYWEVPQSWNIGMGYDNSVSAMLWDGERFAVSRWYRRDGQGDYGAVAGPLLWVYDETGLLYAGCFESSLTVPSTELYNNVVRAAGDLVLEWK